MSKYDSLWKWMKEKDADSIILTFSEIETITKIPLDHSFLTCKKELPAYGYTVKKISMKDKKVQFEKI